MKKYYPHLHWLGLGASLFVLKFKIIMLIFFFFISKSSVEDFIDKLFPNILVRIIVGLAGTAYFGYLVLWKTDRLRRWFKKLK